MLFYELFDYSFLTTTGHTSGGHRPGTHKQVDYADVLVPISEIFTKILNVQIGLFGYQFKILHFVLFALFMIAIKVIWNYATKAI